MGKIKTSHHLVSAAERLLLAPAAGLARAQTGSPASVNIFILGARLIVRWS
jgi:hypothetical protein